jgi:hypothetical protein
MAPGAGARPAVVLGTGWQSWLEPLRKAGVPTGVLAELVESDFEKRWQSRQVEIQGRYMRGEIDADGLAAASIEHDIEMDRDVRAALGSTEYRAWDMDRVLGGLRVGEARLSDGERGHVYDLERGLQDTLRQVQEDKLNGAIDGATAAQRQKDSEGAVGQKLRDLLGDHRAILLEGADDTVGNIRRNLADVQLSDGQVAALADAQRQWDQTRSALVNEQVNTQDAGLNGIIAAKADEWQAQFAQIAGEPALQQYLKQQDSRYVELRRNADRWGVPAEKIDGIYDVLRDYSDSVGVYQQDANARGVDSAAMAAAEKQFAAENDELLAQELPSATYAHLKANGLLLTN